MSPEFLKPQVEQEMGVVMSDTLHAPRPFREKLPTFSNLKALQREVPEKRGLISQVPTP